MKSRSINFNGFRTLIVTLMLALTISLLLPYASWALDIE